MNLPKLNPQKKGYYKKNPLEKNLEEKSDDWFDRFFGTDHGSNEGEKLPPTLARERKEQPQPQRKEFTVFKESVHSENYEIPRQIEQLAAEVKRAIEQLKRSQKALDHQIIQTEKHTIESVVKKPGIYHVRFLEQLLTFIKLLQVKVGEAKTWLSAMQTRKAKRGSLFAKRSKQKGTQYSLSQELATARSVQ